MTVVSEGPLCMKIHLNKQELKKYFTSYSKIHFSDPQVKRTISFLFDIALNSAEFETSGKRTVEVFPTASGGCILRFTSEPLPPFCPAEEVLAQPRNIRLKNANDKNNPYIFAFSDFEAVLSVVERLFAEAKTKNYTCSLFGLKNKYYIEIFIPVFDRKTAIFINEFSVFSAKGKMASAMLKEYASCLSHGNAISVVGNAFFKNN